MLYFCLKNFVEYNKKSEVINDKIIWYIGVKRMEINGDRLAYIVGNDKYQNLKPLGGAVNDADLMKKTLDNCDFITYEYNDLKYENFLSTLNTFKSNCMENKICLFYYAGHGFEYEGNNYLCPIDAKMDKIEESNINISNLVNDLSKDRDFVCIIILDCCRNIYRKERGFTGIKPIVANFKDEGGTYIAYSTSSGKSAVEHDGNGLYTKLLCKHISGSSKPIEQIFKDVRKEMLNICVKENIDKQISWEYSSLVNEFYFKESIVNGGVLSIAKQMIENAYSYEKIIEYVNRYCLKHALKDTSKILLNILNTIDSYVEKGEQDK